MFLLVSVHCTRGSSSIAVRGAALYSTDTVQCTLLTNKTVPVQCKERGNFRGQHSVVRIAICYGLEGPGIGPRLRRYHIYIFIYRPPDPRLQRYLIYQPPDPRLRRYLIYLYIPDPGPPVAAISYITLYTDPQTPGCGDILYNLIYRPPDPRLR